MELQDWLLPKHSTKHLYLLVGTVYDFTCPSDKVEILQSNNSAISMQGSQLDDESSKEMKGSRFYTKLTKTAAKITI